MTVALSAKTRKIVERRVQSGRFKNPEEVVNAALLLLEKQEQAQFAPGELARLVEEGERSIREEGVDDFHTVFRNIRRKSARRRAKKP